MNKLVRSTVVLAALAVACGKDVPQVTFDGARAIEYARIQVDAGPRIPNSEAARLVGDRIVQELRKNADTVFEQRWTHVTQKDSAGKVDSLHMRNIFAQFNPLAKTRILYVSHWDSRPHADNSFAVDDKKKPVPGADDGAASTALLLVLAEALKAHATTVGVDLLFTDGEDYGEFEGEMKDVLIGARYFAEHPLPDASYRPTFGVLWDMVANPGVRVMREAYAEQHARDVNDRVWSMAARLGYSSVFSPDIQDVTDDHRPLLDKGFKVIDVIDLNGYRQYHHTTQDTMDKISAESLTIMGRVALALIRAEEKR
ncbi:MAG TPA: M28 family peptidase [Gemmatimonadaceae bacterium]|nr:M28 family peptidase [Gemmatimonadaceae bacterium]